MLGWVRCLVALDRSADAMLPLGEAREIFVRLGAKPAVDETDLWLARTSALSS